MGSKTIELRLKISEDELMELSDSLERSVKELSDELDEMTDTEDASEITDKIRAAQSVRCKIAIQQDACLDKLVAKAFLLK